MQHRVFVGYQADFPPFMAGDDAPEGLVIDALRERVDALDWTLEWVPLALPEQIPALMENRVDMLAALGVTQERSEQVVFGSPLVQTGGAMFRLVGDRSEVLRIATPATGPLLRSTAESYPAARVVAVDDYPAALAAVFDGEVEAAALNIHVGAEFAERHHPGCFEHPRYPFAPVDLAPAMRPDDARIARLR